MKAGFGHRHLTIDAGYAGDDMREALVARVV
jgi:hypothetical protein